MLRAATEFVRSASEHDRPSELLEALRVVAQGQGLHVMNIFFIPPQSWQFERHRFNRSFFFHPDFPAEKFWAEYRPIATAKGSPTADYARQRSGPFTVTEAMRALQLTGDQRWLIDLYHQYNIRDVLYCASRRWTTLFYSEGIIRLDRYNRQLLAWTAGTAAEQMERLVAKPLSPDQAPGLSPREWSALRLRSLGRGNHEGAKEMGVTVATFRTYLARAMEKLGASDIAHCVALAMRLGLPPGVG